MTDPSFEQQIVSATARLEVERADGSRAIGTGFFYMFGDGKAQTIPALVTNKHVLEDAQRILFYCTRHGSSPGKGFIHCTINVDPESNSILLHPDPGVDLAAVSIGEFVHQTGADGVRLDITYLSSASHIRDEDRQALGPIEDVLIVGYPKGLWDRHNNRPIVRKGLTATDIRLDYNGEPIFLIDAASFRGSSGSPVFLHTAPFRSTPTGTTIAPQVFGFAGVLFARPVRNEVGEMVISQIPVLESDPEEADRLIHLGCVVRAEKLLDLDLIIRSKAKPIDKQ